METYITDERTGLKYELVGDHYLIAGENEPEERSIGVWGQRHLRYLKARRRLLYDCPQVWTLRRYRDYTLAEAWYGRAFIRTYYAISPTLVKWFGHTEWFRKMWKGKLDRMVANLNAEGVEDTPYVDQEW